MTSGNDIQEILRRVHEKQANRENRLKLGLGWFKDLHEGQTCIVMGNGQSLEDVDLDVLDDYFTFGTNFIYRVHIPTYYVLCDKRFIQRWWPRAASFIHRGFVLDQFNAKGLIPVDTDEIEYPDPSPIGSPSAATTLKLAYYMGFSKAYLLGMDFDNEWSHHPAMTEYDEMEAEREENDEPFGPTEDARMRMRHHFLAARRNWKADGREIVNATRGTDLGVFPEVSWRTLRDD